MMDGIEISDKPVTDKRNYRCIELANKLEVLLIQDPETDKASAALSVNVGAYSDPEDLPGLAHFLEHLLFMGTEKFPNENEYSEYLSAHGGFSNAYTASECTNYYFDVAHNHFYGALDRFAQFFSHPLFSETCKDREIFAVDSENKKNLNSDTWRLHQLEKSLSNPNHPFHKFSTGNYETLGAIPASKGVDVRQRLIEFYNQHYSSNLMKLVVLGRESLEVLCSYVEELFSEVKNSDRVLQVYKEPPYPTELLRKMVRAAPVMDVKALCIEFPIPDQEPVYRASPGNYYSHLIGHESRGSLLYFLKAKAWANGLGAGPTHISTNYDLFSLEIELTSLGVEKWQDVLRATFEYIQAIVSQGPQEWVFEELQSVSRASFLYKQKSKPSSTTSQLAREMHKPHIPRKSLLSYSVLQDWEPKMIEEFGKLLVPSNARITLCSKELDQLDQAEKWYGTKYSIQDISEFLGNLGSLPKPLEPALEVPGPNPFVPSNFDVAVPSHKTKHPRLLVNRSGVRVWHKKDDTFLIPKSSLHVKLTASVASSSAKNCVLTELLVLLVSDCLNDYVYYAQVAGLSYALNVGQNGIEIEIYGFNEKIGELLKVVVERLYDFKPAADRFEVIRERLERRLRNCFYAQPYAQLGFSSGPLLLGNVHSVEAKLAELSDICVEDINRHRSTFMEALDIEVLCVGNSQPQDAVEIGLVVEKALHARPVERAVCLSYGLSPKQEVYYIKTLEDAENTNNVIEYRLQVSDSNDLRGRTCLSILSQILKEPAFDQLRTKEQLGYIVSLHSRASRASVWLRVIVQSEESTSYLEQRVEAFFESIKSRLDSLEDAEYEKHVAAVVLNCLEKPKNLKEQASQYWAAISSGYYDFARHEQMAELAIQVPKSEVSEMFARCVLACSAERRKFVVHLRAKKEASPAREVIFARAAGRLVEDAGIDLSAEDLKSVRETCQKESAESACCVLREVLLRAGQSEEAADALVKQVAGAKRSSNEVPPGEAVGGAEDFHARAVVLPVAQPVVDLSEYESQDYKL